MTTEQLPPSRPALSFTLPRNTWLMVAGGFLGGLLLCALVLLAGREKNFYSGQGEAAPGDPSVPLAPLPTPLAAGGDTKLPPIQPGSGERPHLVEPAPAPVAEAPASQPAPEAVASPATPLDAPPQRIAEQSPPPEYPASALRSGRSGVVVLSVQVDADGRPTRVRVSQRSGTRELDRAAVEAVRRWRFRPAQANGQAVPGEVEVPIEFNP